MSQNGKVNFYTDQVLVEIRTATRESIEVVAHRIEERAKANIVANDQVDTGAMLNGIYVVLPDGDNYGAAKSAAEAQKPNGKMASPVKLGSGDAAAVAAGMEYSIYQEAQQSFLYKAAEETAPELAGLLKKI